MSSIERSNELLLERRRNQQTLIRNYIKTNVVINNEEYIDRNKLPTNMRFLTLNIKGLDPKTIVKMERFINSIQKYQIDMILLNKVNVK